MYKPTGLEWVKKILCKAKTGKFLVYYDPDIDGLVAGCLVQRFLGLQGICSEYYINENRAHGFKIPLYMLENLKGYTIIAVDFSMSRKEVKMLVNKGINIIVMDHHNIDDGIIYECSEEGSEGIVINNQYAFEPEEYKFLSGAGVVYYVLKNLMVDFDCDDVKAIVGVSLLSDIRPIENDIAASFLSKTYNHRSKYLNYLVDVTKNYIDYNFGVQVLDRNYIDYTFSPKLNALFRLNKGDDAVRIVNGCYPVDNDLEVFRGMQQAIIEDILKALKGIELPYLVVKGVENRVFFNKYNVANFIGVACSRIKNSGKTTFLYVSEGETFIRGSVRGLYDGLDYLNLFREHGFECAGHKNAFGVLGSKPGINLDNLNKDIENLERGKKDNLYAGRILNVSNLSLSLSNKNKELARVNVYVRDQCRYYIKYTGSNIKKIDKEKMCEFIVDGVTVKCFDKDLDIKDGLVLPIMERGKYVNFYLKKY